MSLFLSEDERKFIKDQYTYGVTARLYWTTLNRVMKRAESPGLMLTNETAMWWHGAEEALTDAAMMQALQPSAQLAGWLRDTTMSVVRRSEADWVGPPFRNHAAKPPMAELETGHLTRAVAVVFDLAPEIFTDPEKSEIRTVLSERAIPMARRHLEHEHHRELHNHRCVINAGLAVAGAVMNDANAMNAAAREFKLYTGAYQSDGTYAETLQYGNYATWCMMLVYESLVRRDASWANKIDMKPYAGFAKWAAYSFLYRKPLAGWGQHARPRSVNFGDSTAIFSPSAELLLHISARAKSSHPTEAALARWLYDTCDDQAPPAPPHDQATFGFVPRPGFLTMPLLAHATAGKSPADLKLPTLHAFSCGDTFARDAWNGRTVLAARSEGEDKQVVSHLHGDMNSFMLIHNNERLLVDPGHSCYRGLLHEFETRTSTHNSCTFYDSLDGKLIEQTTPKNRKIVDLDTLGPPVRRGLNQLLVAQDGDVSVFSSDAGAVYGQPIEKFVRTWILCGTHVAFVVDHIVSTRPVVTRWNWLLNNRDGGLDAKMIRPDRIIARRADAGMKLFHMAGGNMYGPNYAFVHDAYHPLPNQAGEGRQGSGMLYHWREREPATTRTVVHAICLDDAGRIAAWHIESDAAGTTLKGGKGIKWTVAAQASGLMNLTDGASGEKWSIGPSKDGTWSLAKIS